MVNVWKGEIIISNILKQAKRCRILKLNIFKCLTEKENQLRKEWKNCHKSELKSAAKKAYMEEIERYTNVRNISSNKIYKDNQVKEELQIALFENDIVRLAKDDLSDVPFVDKVVFLECKGETAKPILKQILDRGIDIAGKHFIFYSSSAGQLKNQEITLLDVKFYEDNQSRLLCGLTEENINAHGGINMGKFLAYKSLNLSMSVQSKYKINIDEVLVVKDFETLVNDKVNYLDVDTFNIEETEMEVPVPHMDGAGMFMPGTLPCSCQVRGGWIKGAIFPFDFCKFIEKNSCKSFILDAWNYPVPIKIVKQMKIILTQSQLKMWQYYESMDDYREKFKASGAEIAINNFAEPVEKEYIRLSYQPIQTLPQEKFTEERVEQLCKKSVDYINQAKTDPDVALKIMGIDMGKEDIRLDGLQMAIKLYPQLLSDGYVKKKVQESIKAERKRMQSGRIYVKGINRYICPDLYAFCQWLFCGEENPKGLIPQNHIYSKYYNEQDISEVCCIRYPHLSDCEHGIRLLIQSEECTEWFSGDDIVISTHDLLTKTLQADVDGDHIFVISDSAFLDCLGEQKAPLYYRMGSAPKSQITRLEMYQCLERSFDNENIGNVSNAITKILNEENPNLKLVRILCAYNNYVIDFPKTQLSLDLKEYAAIYNKYKDQEMFPPYFFQYAKGKRRDLCCDFHSYHNVDRVSEYIKKKTSNGITKISCLDDVNGFNPETLKDMSIPVKRGSEDYKRMRKLLLKLKMRASSYLRSLISEYNQVYNDQILAKELIYIFCLKQFDEIIPDRKMAASYLVDIEYYQTEFSEDYNKDVLWGCYGEILAQNVEGNVNQNIELPLKRKAYQTSQEKAEEIVHRIEKIRKRQEDLAAVPITKSIYDFIFNIECKKNCRKDRELLYILYVLYQRYVAKSEKEVDCLLLASGKNSKGIKRVTIDEWIGSKIADKGLKRLEKAGYIKQEKLRKYIKISFYLPDPDENQLFYAKEPNPLIDLYQYNGKYKIKICEVCGQKFLSERNRKTCSNKCSELLCKRNSKKDEFVDL